MSQHRLGRSTERQGEMPPPLGVMAGVKVVEVALFGFVPSAGAALADWGADVIKVEHPEIGDPMRSLAAWGIAPGTGGMTHMWEIFNRGKRSVGVDLATPDGVEVLHTLLDDADVFVTSFMASDRSKLRIDVADIRSRHPSIVYARGTGHGVHGPDADKGGFDGISYWARTGASTATMPRGTTVPIQMPGPAFGDIQAGMHLAGGIAAALYRRERTGHGAVVDVSLLGSGMWAMQPVMAATYVTDRQELYKPDRFHPTNPLANVSYRTSDGRFIALSMLESDRYWPGLCRVIGRPELATDERFASAHARTENAELCVKALDAVFAERPLAEWTPRLALQEGQWAVIRLPREVLDDPQGPANGYLQYLDYGSRRLPLVTAPAQFDETPPQLRPAPVLGADTDEILSAAGMTMDQLLDLKIAGVIT